MVATCPTFGAFATGGYSYLICQRKAYLERFNLFSNCKTLGIMLQPEFFWSFIPSDSVLVHTIMT